MNIARMEKFESLWAIRHDLPAESLAQYRFESREGYRLPELAAHYRTFVETLESIVVVLPIPPNAYDLRGRVRHSDVVKAVEAAGLKVTDEA